MNDRKAVNPFFLGSEFLNYCLRQGYLDYEIREDHRLHYYISEKGLRELPERFGVDFSKPCAYEAQD